MAAGFIQNTLWRGLAQCFDFDSSSSTQCILHIPLLYIVLESDWATRLSQAKLWANWSPISPHVSFMLDIIPLILPDYDVADDDHFIHVIPTDSTDSLRSYMVTIITLHSALMQLGGLI